jgi:ribosomal protein S18 acetylase RimI-like enzyme
MQGRGVGRALLGTLEAAGVLVTDAASEENLRLYRRAGYEPVDERVDDIEPVDDIGVRLLVLAKRVIQPGRGVSVNGGAGCGP